MPGPQSLTPKPVSATKPLKRFTLAQANQTLPLVKRIVADIVHAHADAARCQKQLETAKPAQEHQLRDRIQTDLEHLQDYVDELTDVGCELKDYKTGLIDFVGSHEGRDVCLCWKLGEERIGFWHELSAGFAGRRPVSELHEV